jgi:hypothetical protein
MSFKEIPLTQGKVALVDEEDFKLNFEGGDGVE